MDTKARKTSTVDVVAEVLRARVFEKKAGESLGSEEELVRQTGVSRPTLRQAARVLEHEQLLTIRRGIGGGYFVSRPNAAMVARAAALYLRSTTITSQKMTSALIPLLNEAAMLAARCRDPDLRIAFQSLLKQVGEAEIVSPATAGVLGKRFSLLFAEMCDNPPIKLFMQALYDLYDYFLMPTVEQAFQNDPVRIEHWRKSMLVIGQTVLAGDGELVFFLMRRLETTMANWAAGDGDKA